VYVRKGGGSFIIDSEANVEFNTIFVEDSARLAVNDGAKVTTEQSNFIPVASFTDVVVVPSSFTDAITVNCSVVTFAPLRGWR